MTIDRLEDKYIMMSTILGKGSYSEVRLGRCKQSCSKVAIKINSKSELANSSRKRNLVSEIKILKSVSHPKIVKLLDVAEDSENVYLILEYVDGISLSQYVK